MTQPLDEAARIEHIYTYLMYASKDWDRTTMSHYVGQPFPALIAGMMSARTREEDTLAAMQALFALAESPADMLKLSEQQIAAAIAPVTYHEVKAGRILRICQRLLENGGEVPRDRDALMAYEGVGWKVAVLVQRVAFGIVDEICVDVHVGRIGKRLGLVNPATTQPEKIARELEAKLPHAYWDAWNPLMVRFGRHVCYPTRPACERCPVRAVCPRIGV